MGCLDHIERVAVHHREDKHVAVYSIDQPGGGQDGCQSISVEGVCEVRGLKFMTEISS